MFKKLFLRFSLWWWILKERFKKEEKENYWQDEWPYESSPTYIWDREFLEKVISKNKELNAK
jgi:hypothetical protein|tara:strand:+ start:251 stop:436 length:186 start_codon:yes stop_codon:yes gene_type:complete